MPTMLKRFGLLALLNSLNSGLPAVLAQSDVARDLSAATFDDIRRDVPETSNARMAIESSVYIPGYNVSAPRGFGPTGNGSAVNGWELGIVVDQKLPYLNNPSDFKVESVLWLRAPPGVSHVDMNVWRICATVFPYVNMSALNMIPGRSHEGRHDGNCGPWVTDQCANGLSTVGLSKGVSDFADCYIVDAPPSCLPYFEKGKAKGKPIEVKLGPTENNRLFAWGILPPTYNGAGEHDAEHRVWPVLLTWMQLDTSHRVFAANTHTSCVVARASRSTTKDGSAVLAAGTFSSTARCAPTKAWAMAALIAVTFVLFI